jgi:nitrate/TMAO reductase-like tetraheme cytochrome c subunit
MGLPKIVHNWVSYAGAAIAVLSLVVFGFLSILHTVGGAEDEPYAGLVIFIIVPAFLLFGLALIPVGMLLEWRRWKRTGIRSMPRFPVIDLNNSRHRNATALFGIGSFFLLFFTVFASYHAYEYTDSNEFCGELCHEVMKPEYTTYQNSPHARVTCVECHVGPGADWFVRSKLSGAYQVYAVLANKYPRPIPTPIKNLRPAQDTCEQCHWPQQFFGAQQVKRTHFLEDEQNTRWDIHLLVKTGGGSPATGLAEGIHWHMNISNRIEYIAADNGRQEIPWIRATNLETGESTTYQSPDNPLTEEEIAAAEVRIMDCMDCHNRPTHIYRDPDYSVNLALATAKIDSTLPYIKATGVELLAAHYPAVDTAMTGIREGLEEYYRENHPTVLSEKPESIAEATSSLQAIYRQNFFPEMKASWANYPDHSGHLKFRGCYRCHDAGHEGDNGEVISADCRSCHTILGQGSPGQMTFSTDPGGLEFQHPVDIGEAWKEIGCYECHGE